MKNNFKKTVAIAAAVLIVTATMTACSDKNTSSSAITTTTAPSVTESDVDTSIAASDLDVGYDETSSTTVSFSNSSAEISGNGAQSDGGVVTITEAGTYILSGTISNGRVIVAADKKAEVKLVFNGVNITCTDNAPIYVSKADKVYVILEDGTENTLCDGSTYNLGEDDANTDACLFSKSDLTINGGGTLNVTSNYKHGIVSKDDLVITDGVINVTSTSTAIEGKDSVKISGGNFTISAGTNGIKATNTEDTAKGFISITGGTFNIVSNNDAIEAETVLTIEDGTMDITTGGGSANASTKSDGSANGDWQKDMGNGGGGPMGNGGDMGNPPDAQPANETDELTLETAANTTTDVTLEETTDETSDDTTSTSAKALKAGTEIDIKGGTITIDSADDSIHSNGDVNIMGGTVSASSGDDGVHADGNLTISDGTVSILKSYEGLEGATVTITGGTNSVAASDDGINCSGGSDTGSTDRMGADQFSSQDGVFLKISGGTTTVDADGDGLDSNGDFYMDGGTVYVSGPTNGGNGALDYNGTAQITGGTIIACGAVGMEQGFDDTSTQYSALYDLSSTIAANTEVTVSDSSGNVLLSYTPTKTWQSMVFSSADLKQGETYTITAGSVSETVTLDSINTSNATGSGMGGGMGGGRGGKSF